MDEIIRAFVVSIGPQEIIFTTARAFGERQQKILFQQIHRLTT